MNFKEIGTQEVRVFQLWEDEIVYLIKTGFEDKYILLYEDAHEQSIGKTQILTGKEVENYLGIEL